MRLGPQNSVVPKNNYPKKVTQKGRYAMTECFVHVDSMERFEAERQRNTYVFISETRNGENALSIYLF